MKKQFILPLIIIIIVSTSCERLFEYTLYSANVKESRKLTHDKNLKRLKVTEEETKGNESFKFALISDSHTYYDELDEAVELINKDEAVEFVIHGGDMTDGGMIAEYSIFYKIMENLHQPYFTVIGNHDCLANGRVIYNDQYGPENYSFIYKNCKFIFFNDIVWELNNEEPDFKWLSKQLEDYTQNERIFVIAHIPPWTDQFSPLDTWAYTSLMDTADVSMSIHGHNHGNYYGNYFRDSIPYLVIGAPSKGVYCNLIVESDTIILETIEF